MRDFDCKDSDESKIVMLFDSGAIGFLNIQDNSFSCKYLKSIEWIDT